MPGEKKRISYSVGTLQKAQSGIWHGRIHGQKVFLNGFKDEQGNEIYIVNQVIEAFVSDPKPRETQGSREPDFF
jgi:hypothetical protein